MSRQGQIACSLLLLVLAVSPAAADSSIEVQVVVDAWVRAQNDGDYKAYAALYATEFAGIKRVDQKASSKPKPMNRKKWLADRKKMFKKPMVVTAENVTIAVDGTHATVELTQSWSQGVFADRGKKRLELDALDSGWILVREEMLDSRALLNQAACRATLYPKSKDTHNVKVLDLGGDRWVCTGETRLYAPVERNEVSREVMTGTSVEAMVVVLSFGKKWKVVDQADASYFDFDEDGEGSTGSVEVEAIKLSAKETAMLVTVTSSDYGPEMDDGKATATLYRISGAELEALLEFDSEWSTGEADETRRCELEVGKKASKGYQDLVVACEEATADWQSGDQASKKTRTGYRWDGKTYAEK